MAENRDFYQAQNIANKLESAKLINTPNSIKKAGKWVGGTFIFLVLCLFLPWTQNIRSNGIVTSFNPADRPQTIHSTIAGRIEKWYVNEGNFVKKGDTIVSLSEIKDKYFDPDFLLRIGEQIKSKDNTLKSTQDKAVALNNQIQALRDGLKYKISQAQNKIQQYKLKVKSDSIDFVAQKTEYEIAKVQFDRQEKLYEQGLKSLTELEQRKLKLQESVAKLMSAENKFFTTKNELVNTIIDINAIEAEYLDKISKAESDLQSTLGYYYTSEGELSKMNNEYANMQIRNSFYNVTAPQDGYLVKALRVGIGETVTEGEAVASIMPNTNNLAVELFVDPIDIPLLKKGNKVRLQFDGWPALVFSGWPNVSFGTFGGEVMVIDNIDTDGKYRILVTPDKTDEHWPQLIRVGSGVYGWALLKDVPIWFELWRNMNGFPPDFTGELPGKKDKNKQEKKAEKKEE